MNEKYDWGWVCEYYMRAQKNNKPSLKEISILFDIPYQTVRRKAEKENWIGNSATYIKGISYFKDQQAQEDFLKLAIHLAKKDYSKLEAMNNLE